MGDIKPILYTDKGGGYEKSEPMGSEAMSMEENIPPNADEPSYGPWVCFDCKKTIPKGEPYAYRATKKEYPGVNENGLVAWYLGHRYFCIPCCKVRDDAEDLCDEVESLRERVRELIAKGIKLKADIKAAISPFDDIEHWEDCPARTDENEDDIDCNPLDHIDGCDCVVKMISELYCLINPPVEPTKGDEQV
jgi:hypothetical protein